MSCKKGSQCNNVLFYKRPAFTSSVTPVTPSDYLLRYVDGNTEFIPMDGINLIEYESELHLIFGWNASIDYPPASKKTHWKSADGGKTWTALTDFPGTERHRNGYALFQNKIWIFGGDFLTDVWTYDSINGWVQVTADWGIGDVVFFAYWADANYLYVAGGQDTIPSGNFYSTVYRSADGITWTSIGNLPSADISTGQAYVDGTTFYVLGGGQYIGGAVTNYNANIYKSVDGGANWTTLASTLPVTLQTGYPSICAWDSKCWFLLGDNAGNNQPGIYYTTDFITWTQLYDNPRARHASSLTVHNDKLMCVAGNMWNDSYSIEKVAVTTGIADNPVACYMPFNLVTSDDAWIKVEKSGGAFTDIGYNVDGTPDTASLLTWAGMDEVRVTTYYDRTVNTNHITAAYADAPVICNAGALNVENGIAALLCTASTQMDFGFPLSLGTTHVIHVVCNMTSYSSILGDATSYVFYPTATDISYYNAAGSYTYNYSGDVVPFPLNQQVLVSLYRKGEEVQMFLNGQKMGNASACINDFMGTNMALTISTLLGQAGYNFVGNFQGALLYEVDTMEKFKATTDKIIELFNITV